LPITIPLSGDTILLNGAQTANQLSFKNTYSLSTGSLSLATGKVDVMAGAVATFRTSLTGSAGLTKTGAGTMVVSSAATYAGNTVISNGTLKLQAAGLGGGSLSGFGSNGSGWTLNNGATVSSDVLTLTVDGGSSARTAFWNSKVSTGAFSTSFVYTASGSRVADGVTFVLQNDSRGLTAVGDQGGNMAYGNITNSAAFVLNIYGFHGVGTTFTTGGIVGGPYDANNPVNLASGNPIQVNLTYDGSNFMVVQLTDTVTGANLATTYTTGNLATITGGSTAYMGFTGATGGASAIQTISNFSINLDTDANLLPTDTAVTLASGTTFDLNGVSQRVASLADATTGSTTGHQVFLGGGMLTVGDSTSTVFSGAISGQGVVTKIGAGTLALSGANGASATVVNHGTLLANGTASGRITVNGSASARGTLSGTGTLTGGVSLVSDTSLFSEGAILNPGTVGGAGTLTINSEALIATRYSNLNFDIGSAVTIGGGVNDLISSDVAPVIAGPTQVNINTLGTLTIGNLYTLIGGYTGTIADFGNLQLNATFTGADTSKVGVLQNNQGALQLLISLGTAYWSGGIDGNWNTLGTGGTSNWRMNAAGNVDPNVLPDSATDVNFATTNPLAGNLDTTLGRDFTVKSLTVHSTATSPISISGNTLTTSNGIGVSQGAGPVTINSDVVLSGGQAWTNDSFNKVTVNGSVTSNGQGLTLSGSGDGVVNGNTNLGGGGLSKDGTGIWTLNSANSYSGGTYIYAGALAVRHSEALGYYNDINIYGGTLMLENNITLENGSTSLRGYGADGRGALRNVSGDNTLRSFIYLEDLTRINSDSGTLTLGSGGYAMEMWSYMSELHLGGAGNGVIDGMIDGLYWWNESSLYKDGTGTWALTNINSDMGSIHITGGTLELRGYVHSYGYYLYSSWQVANGGNLSLADGTANYSSNNWVALDDGANLTFDWVGSATDWLEVYDYVDATGNIGVIVKPSDFPTGSHTLMTSYSGGLENAHFYLANNTNFTATLTQSASELYVDNYQEVTAPDTFYWVGNQVAGTNTSGVDNTWTFTNGTASNWSSTRDSYTATPVVPGSAAHVVFSGTGPDATNHATVLGADVTVNRITFDDSTTVTVGGNHNLTLMGTGTGDESAIVVTSSSADPTISSQMALGADQTWTIADHKTLYVSGAISGTHSLTKAGLGSLELGGTNLYTGTTFVDAGVLYLNAGSDAIVGDLVVRDATAKLLHDNQISDRSIVWMEDGTFDVGIYSDTVAAVQLKAGEIVGPGGTLTSNTLFDLQSGNVSANLGGAARLIKSTSGTVTLSGASTHTGGTFINAGKLRTMNAGALGTGPVMLTGGTLAVTGTINLGSLYWNGGTLQLAPSSGDIVHVTNSLINGGLGGAFVLDTAGLTPGTYTLMTFGSTNFTRSGLTALALDSTLSLMGQFQVNATDIKYQLSNITTASAGSQRLHNMHNGLSPTSNYTVNGSVVSGQTSGGAQEPNTVINSLTINSGSSLEVPGTNTLHVTGNASMNHSSLNVDGSMSVGGNFVDPNSHIVVSGLFQIGGNADLFSGSVLRITPGGIMTVGHATNINAGVMVSVNGVLQSPVVNVNHGGLLKGAGLIIGNVFNSGTVAPGNSPGTLTIDGNYTQTRSGTLQIEIASHRVFDRLIVSGTARLAGTLDVRSLGRKLSYGDQYPFLQAGRIVGKFDRIQMPNPGIYRGRFLVDGGAGILLVAPTSYTLVATNKSQRSLAKALDHWIGEEQGDVGLVTLALDAQTEDQYPAAFNAISPASYGVLPQAGIERTVSHNSLLQQRMGNLRAGVGRMTVQGARTEGAPPPSEAKRERDRNEPKEVVFADFNDARWSTWLQLTGQFAEIDTVQDLANGDFDTAGALVGADYRIGRESVIGLAVGYDFTDGDGDFGDQSEVDDGRISAYASFGLGHGFYLNAVVGAAFSNYEAERPIRFSFIDRTAKGETDGSQLFAAVEFGKDFQFANWTVTPSIGVQYTYLEINGFTETNAGVLGLALDDFNAESLRLDAGLMVNYHMQLSEHVRLSPYLHISWQHELEDGDVDIHAALPAGGGEFDWNTGGHDSDRLLAGCGLFFEFDDKASINLGYQADFGADDYQSHLIFLQLTRRL
jgi:autotransporter-associated beta strand protein